MRLAGLLGFFTFSLAAFGSTPELSLSVLGDTVVKEGQESPSVLTFEVSLSEPSSSEVSVNFQTSDGQAVAGEDYQAEDTTIVFSPGETKKLYQVFTAYDKKDEPLLEQFDVKLSAPKGATLGMSAQIITIKDDDEVISISKFAQVVEKNQGEAPQVSVTISREYDSGETVVFGVETQDGSAVGGEDYQKEYTTLALQPGELEKTFMATAIGDDKFEDHESFFVEIWSNQDNVSVKNERANVGIVDDDGRIHFIWNLNATLSSAQGAAIQASTSGEIQLEKTVNDEGNTVYKGEGTLTHRSVWDRIGPVGTIPAHTSVKLYAIDNEFTLKNMRVEWEVGRGTHLRCVIPMQGEMNCPWYAGILQYHKTTNWTPPSAGKGGVFLLKGFKSGADPEDGYSSGEKVEVLTYSPQGRVNINEKGVYKLVRKQKSK